MRAAIGPCHGTFWEFVKPPMPRPGAERRQNCLPGFATAQVERMFTPTARPHTQGKKHWIYRPLDACDAG